MSRSLALFSLVCCLSAIVPRQADAGEIDRQDEFVYHLLATPLYLVWSLNVHEGMHALTGAALGEHVESYKPYPHMEDLGFGSILVAGSVEIREPVSPGHMAWISLAPFMGDALVFAAADLSLNYVDPSSHAAPFILFAGMLWTWSDFFGGWLFRLPGCDIDQFHRDSGLPAWTSWAAGGAMLGVGTWRLYERMRQIATAKPRHAILEEPGFTAAPMYLPQGFGLSASYRF